MNKLADLVEKNVQLLAEIEAWDSGKPVRIVRLVLDEGGSRWNRGLTLSHFFSRDMDLVDAIATLRYYAGESHVCSLSCNSVG